MQRGQWVGERRAEQKGKEVLVFGYPRSSGGGIWLLAVGRRLETSWTSGQPEPGKGETVSLISSQVSLTDFPASPQYCQKLASPRGAEGWVGRSGTLKEPSSGRGGAGRGGSLTHSPLPFSMRMQACFSSHPFPSPLDQTPEVGGGKEGVKPNDDDFDFFPSCVRAWGGWLFCFLDLGGEFSARQSSPRSHCFLMLL